MPVQRHAKITGSGSSLAEMTRPLASFGFDGTTVFRPQTSVKSASGLWLGLPAEDAAAHRHAHQQAAPASRELLLDAGVGVVLGALVEAGE